jgi:hypothetical protein
LKAVIAWFASDLAVARSSSVAAGALREMADIQKSVSPARRVLSFIDIDAFLSHGAAQN